MGLLDWFRAAASADTNEDISTVTLDPGESPVLAGLNFQDAVAAHQRWKIQLRACIDGNCEHLLAPSTVSDDCDCVLGKWLNESCAHGICHTPTFIELKRVHADFHRIAGQVLSAVYTGRRAEAEEIMGSAFAPASARIVMLLSTLFLEAQQQK